MEKDKVSFSSTTSKVQQDIEHFKEQYLHSMGFHSSRNSSLSSSSPPTSSFLRRDSLSSGGTRHNSVSSSSSQEENISSLSESPSDLSTRRESLTTGLSSRRNSLSRFRTESCDTEIPSHHWSNTDQSQTSSPFIEPTERERLKEEYIRSLGLTKRPPRPQGLPNLKSRVSEFESLMTKSNTSSKPVRELGNSKKPEQKKLKRSPKGISPDTHILPNTTQHGEHVEFKNLKDSDSFNNIQTNIPETVTKFGPKFSRSLSTPKAGTPWETESSSLSSSSQCSSSTSGLDVKELLPCPSVQVTPSSEVDTPRDQIENWGDSERPKLQRAASLDCQGILQQLSSAVPLQSGDTLRPINKLKKFSMDETIIQKAYTEKEKRFILESLRKSGKLLRHQSSDCPDQSAGFTSPTRSPGKLSQSFNMIVSRFEQGDKKGAKVATKASSGVTKSGKDLDTMKDKERKEGGVVLGKEKYHMTETTDLVTDERSNVINDDKGGGERLKGANKNKDEVYEKDSEPTLERLNQIIDCQPDKAPMSSEGSENINQFYAAEVEAVILNERDRLALENNKGILDNEKQRCEIGDDGTKNISRDDEASHTQACHGDFLNFDPENVSLSSKAVSALNGCSSDSLTVQEAPVTYGNSPKDFSVSDGTNSDSNYMASSLQKGDSDIYESLQADIGTHSDITSETDSLQTETSNEIDAVESISLDLLTKSDGATKDDLQLSTNSESYTVNSSLPQDRGSAINSSYGIDDEAIKKCPERTDPLKSMFLTPAESLSTDIGNEVGAFANDEFRDQSFVECKGLVEYVLSPESEDFNKKKTDDSSACGNEKQMQIYSGNVNNSLNSTCWQPPVLETTSGVDDEKLNSLNIKPSAHPGDWLGANEKHSFFENMDENHENKNDNNEQNGNEVLSRELEQSCKPEAEIPDLVEIGYTYGRVQTEAPCADYCLDDVFEDRSVPMGTDVEKELDDLSAVFVHVNEKIVPCGAELSGQDEKSSVVEDSGFEDTDLLLDQESGIADVYSLDYKGDLLRDDNLAMSTASEGSLSPSALDQSVTRSSFDSSCDDRVQFPSDPFPVLDLETNRLPSSGNKKYNSQKTVCFTDHSEEFVFEKSDKIVLKMSDLANVRREPFKHSEISKSVASRSTEKAFHSKDEGGNSFYYEQNLTKQASSTLSYDNSLISDEELTLSRTNNPAEFCEEEPKTQMKNIEEDLCKQKETSGSTNGQRISDKSEHVHETLSASIFSEVPSSQNDGTQCVNVCVEKDEGKCESTDHDTVNESRDFSMASSSNIISGTVFHTVIDEMENYAVRLAHSLLLECRSEIANSKILKGNCEKSETKEMDLEILKHEKIQNTENLETTQEDARKNEISDTETGCVLGCNENGGEVSEHQLTSINKEEVNVQNTEFVKGTADNSLKLDDPENENRPNIVSEKQTCESVKAGEKVHITDSNLNHFSASGSPQSQEMLVDQTKRLNSTVASSSNGGVMSSRQEGGLFCVRKSYSEISGSVDSFYSGVSGSGDSFHSADDLDADVERTKRTSFLDTVEKVKDSCSIFNSCDEHRYSDNQSNIINISSSLGETVEESENPNISEKVLSDQHGDDDLSEIDTNLQTNLNLASVEHPLPNNLFGEADFFSLYGDNGNGEKVKIHWNDNLVEDSDEDEGNESFEDCSEESDDSFNPAGTDLVHSMMRHFVDDDDEDDDEVFADCTDEDASSDVSEKNDTDSFLSKTPSSDITTGDETIFLNSVNAESGHELNLMFKVDDEGSGTINIDSDSTDDITTKGNIVREVGNVEILGDVRDKNEGLLDSDLSIIQDCESHKLCQADTDKISSSSSADTSNENSSVLIVESGESCPSEQKIQSPRRKAFSTSMLDDLDFSPLASAGGGGEFEENEGDEMVFLTEDQRDNRRNVTQTSEKLEWSKTPGLFDKEEEVSSAIVNCKGHLKSGEENAMGNDKAESSLRDDKAKIADQVVCELCLRGKLKERKRATGFYLNSGSSDEGNGDGSCSKKCHEKGALTTVEPNSEDSLCFEGLPKDISYGLCSSSGETKQGRPDDSYERESESRKDSGSDESSHSMDKDSLDEDDDDGKMSSDHDGVITQSGRAKSAVKTATDKSQPVPTSNPPPQHEPPSSPLGLESQNGSPPLCSLSLLQDNDPDLAKSQDHVTANGSQDQENHSSSSSAVEHSMTLDNCYPEELDHAPPAPRGKKSKVKQKRWKEAEDAGSSDQKANKKLDTPLHLDLACVDMAEVDESNTHDLMESPSSGLHRISSAGDFCPEEGDSKRSHDPYRMLERSQSDASLLKKDLELLAQDDEVHLTAAESSSGQNISECNRVYLDLSRAEAFERVSDDVELGETSGNMMRTSSGRLLETIPQDEELKTVDLSYVYATHRSFSQESSSSVEDLTYSKGKSKDGCSGKYKCAKTSQDSSSITSKSNLKSSFQIYSHSLKQKVRQLQMGSLPEQLNALSELNVLMEQAWSMPIYGKDLAYELCDILRTESALDIIVSNLASNNRDLMKVSARLLEQSLTTSNRRQVAENGLELVVKMTHDSRGDCELAQTCTGILESLFKTSEDTCAKVIKLGGLDVITYWCRCNDRVTLKNCAIALSNLALYGGGENQQEMAKHKVPEWLFPLAFVEDDSVRYYALLAIGVMVSNKEIENAVMSSGTLALVLPFIDSHDPAEFAQRDMSHRHGRSPGWLKRLIPVLSSKREEAQALAAFHFVMEAGIKSEQGRKEVLYKIGAVDPLKWLASTPNRVASKLAAQALQIIGEEIPHKLSQQVPLWTCDDVVHWIAQVGFGAYADKFKSTQVDGDLLLQLTEDELRDSLNMPCAITRKRFLRELRDLKISSDYTSCDPSMLGAWLREVGEDMSQYTYQMLYSGLDRPLLRSITDTHLTSDCKIRNGIHRMKIMAKIEELKSSANSPASAYDGADGHSLTPGLHKPPIDVFISYRRSNGSQLARPWNIDGLVNGPHTNKPFIDVYISYRRQDGCKLASLLKVHLQLRGFTVFIDIEKLRAGKFDEGLLESVRQAKNFIIVLTPNSLDRCMGDDEKKDWVHREITAAIEAGSNIIPLIDNFKWPSPDSLPEDMRNVLYFNAVRWIHDYQDACVDKLEQFLRGEPNPQQSYPASTISNNHVNSPPKQSAASFESPNSPPYQRAQGMNKTASVDSPDS